MTLRVGLVGCGLIARRSHLPAFQASSEARVTAVASGRVENAQSAAAEFEVERVHNSWHTLVEDPGVDAVAVCTTNSTHAEIAIAAARNGKHVLVEKPMATSVEECDAMIAAARDAGVTLMVAHNLRFTPAFEALKKVVEDGLLGRVYVARGVFMHAGPDDSWGSTRTWFFDEAGALLDMGVHILDLLRSLIGTRVELVTALTSRVEKPTAMDDNAMVLMQFGDGVIASAQTGWTARPHNDTEVVIHGERGHVAFSRAFKRPLAVRLVGGETIEPEVARESALVNPFVHFARCVRDGVRPLTPGEEGRDTLAVAMAAYESAATRRAVRPA